MPDNKDSKPEPKPDIVRGTVELFVTPELRERLERKIQKRRNERMLGEELRAKLNRNIRGSIIDSRAKLAACEAERKRRQSAKKGAESKDFDSTKVGEK